MLGMLGFLAQGPAPALPQGEPAADAETVAASAGFANLLAALAAPPATAAPGTKPAAGPTTAANAVAAPVPPETGTAPAPPAVVAGNTMPRDPLPAATPVRTGPAGPVPPVIPQTLTGIPVAAAPTTDAMNDGAPLPAANAQPAPAAATASAEEGVKPAVQAVALTDVAPSKAVIRPALQPAGPARSTGDVPAAPRPDPASPAAMKVETAVVNPEAAAAADTAAAEPAPATTPGIPVQDAPAVSAPANQADPASMPVEKTAAGPDTTGEAPRSETLSRPATTAQPRPTGTADGGASITRQVSGGLARALADGATEAVRIRLQPEHLGRVDVQLTARGDQLQVVLAAGTVEAERALRENIAELVDGLGRGAARYQNVDVRVETREGAEDRSQQRDEGRREAPSRGTGDGRGGRRQQSGHEPRTTAEAWADLARGGF
jgi:hypothetical protein